MTEAKKTDAERLHEIGKGAYAVIVEMVDALNADYDRLEELREERRALYEDRDCNNTNAAQDLAQWDEENADELAALEADAGDCADYEQARERIEQDALSVRVRGDWYSPGYTDLGDLRPAQFELLLTTGGPAVRIMGELDRGEPVRAWLEVQDWFQPWTQYFPADQETLLAYARCFYYGE